LLIGFSTRFPIWRSRFKSDNSWLRRLGSGPHLGPATASKAVARPSQPGLRNGEPEAARG
jgi:hypothetical protein